MKIHLQESLRIWVTPGASRTREGSESTAFTFRRVSGQTDVFNAAVWWMIYSVDLAELSQPGPPGLLVSSVHSHLTTGDQQSYVTCSVR